MTITAELKSNARLFLGGTIYERNKPVPVSEDVARVLLDDDRFVVTGFKGSKVKEDRAVIRTIASRIRDAATEINPDVEDNYTADGRISFKAISAKIGQAVTQQQVDKALGVKTPEAPKKLDLDVEVLPADSDTAEKIEGPFKTAKVVVISGPTEHADLLPLENTPVEDVTDPSKSGAVEV